QGEHDLVFPPRFNGVALPEGGWEAFQRNPQRLSQIKHNEISYMWDALIEEFNRHALAGTQYYSSDDELQGLEEVLRLCAAEPRTRRRMLARALKEMLETTPTDWTRRRIILPSQPGDPHYVFVLVPRSAAAGYEEYRERRREYLQMCMCVAKLKCPE